MELSQLEKGNWEHLYNCYYNKLYKIATSYLKNTELAKDVVQEAFIHFIETPMFQKLECYREEEVLAFLITMTQNKSRTLKKRYNRESLFCDYINEEILFENFDNTMSIVLHHADIEQIYEILHSLSKMDQKLLILKYIYGVNTKEIAEKYCIQPFTVRKRIERAKRRFQKLCINKFSER